MNRSPLGSLIVEEKLASVSLDPLCPATTGEFLAAGKSATGVDGRALDIGGTWARLYRFTDGRVAEVERVRLEGDGNHRVAQISELVAGLGPGGLPTACAGRKNSQRSEVLESNFSEPLVGLCAQVASATGVRLGPLYDDDTCAGWGHLCSPGGGLKASSPNTLVLTAGTGVAENLWVDGRFLEKGTYPSVSQLGLETALRAEAWRAFEVAASGLMELLEARAALATLKRVVLSGRLAELSPIQVRRLGLALRCPVEVSSLPEAPALGALVLASRQRKADGPIAP